MDRIKQLLERYWQCETSVEEERELRRFFSEGDIPEDLSSYKCLFSLTQKNSEVKAPSVVPVQKKPRFVVGFYPLLKVAAVALIFFTFGIGIYTHYQQDKKIEQMISETYTDPQEAVKDTQEAVAKVSSLLLLIEQNNQSDVDSLQIKE